MFRFPGYQDQNKQQENGLHIADLEEGITEEQLYVEFRKFGQISFVKLHRYPLIGKSKHYAFIYFSSQEEARKAKEAMNYKQLLREPMRITYIQEYEKDANLFFAGFELTTTLKQLEEFFLKWGQVVSVKLSIDENKKSRGYGWVQYEKKEQANALLADSTDGTIMYNEKKPIIVKRFVKKGQSDREDKRNNLYIKNFWPSLDTYDLDNAEVRESLEKEMRTKLDEWFNGFGQIVSILVKIDIERKAPFAFVSFNRHQDAKEAQRTLGTNQKKDPLSTGRMMYVGWAQTKTDRKQQRDNNIFAKYIYADHLSRNVTEEMIRTTLNECGYGDIQMIRLEKMQQGFQQIIRIGYIVFEQASDANKLIKNFKSNEKFEEIKKLFDPNVETAGGKYFQHLFPQQSQQRGQRRNNQRQSPNRRMNAMPQGPMPFGQRMPFPPYQMQQRMQGGPGGMRRPFQQQIPGFPQPIRPNIPPPVQQPDFQQQAPAQIVPFNKRQDLVDLMANLEAFKAKPQEDQLRQIQQMLYYRIKARLNTDTEAHWKRISEILSDPTNYSIDEIIDMFKEEEQFNSFVDEAIEQLKEASSW